MLKLSNKKIRYFVVNKLNPDDLYGDVTIQRIMSDSKKYDFGIILNSLVDSVVFELNIPIYSFGSEPYHKIDVDNEAFNYMIMFANFEKILSSELFSENFLKWFIVQFNKMDYMHYYFITDVPIFKFYTSHHTYIKQILDTMMNKSNEITLITVDGDYYKQLSYHKYYIDKIRKLDIVLVGSASTIVNEAKLFKYLNVSNFCDAAYTVVKSSATSGYIIGHSDLLQHFIHSPTNIDNLDNHVIHSILRTSNNLSIVMDKMKKLSDSDAKKLFIRNNKDIITNMSRLELYEEFSDEYDSLQKYLDDIDNADPIITYQKQQFIIGLPDKLLALKVDIKKFIIDNFGVEKFTSFLMSNTWNLSEN